MKKKKISKEVLEAQKKLLMARYRMLALREQDKEKAEDERYQKAG